MNQNVKLQTGTDHNDAGTSYLQTQQFDAPPMSGDDQSLKD